MDTIMQHPHGPLARKILEVCSFLAPAAIPHFLIEVWCQQLHKNQSPLELGSAVTAPM